MSTFREAMELIEDEQEGQSTKKMAEIDAKVQEASAHAKDAMVILRQLQDEGWWESFVEARKLIRLINQNGTVVEAQDSMDSSSMETAIRALLG